MKLTWGHLMLLPLAAHLGFCLYLLFADGFTLLALKVGVLIFIGPLLMAFWAGLTWNKPIFHEAKGDRSDG